MKKLISIILFCIIATQMFAIENYSSVKTAIDSARYEIIQSSIARKITMKLDKKTGSTYLFVQKEDGTHTWDIILNTSLLLGKEVNDKNVCNYQIFMGGIALRDCFLINIHTGRTWMLYSLDDDNLVWSEIEE